MLDWNMETKPTSNQCTILLDNLELACYLETIDQPNPRKNYKISLLVSFSFLTDCLENLKSVYNMRVSHSNM